MKEKVEEVGGSSSLRHAIRAFAATILGEIKSGILHDTQNVAERCSNLIEHETTADYTERLLECINEAFKRLGSDCPKAHLDAVSGLLERLRGGDELDPELAETDQPGEVDTAPEAPVSAVPPQQVIPPTTAQPSEPSNETPVIEMVDVDKIKTSELFEKLFSTQQQVVIQLVADMLERGYDPAHPLCLWGETLIDGHQRRSAAQQARIKQVPVVRLPFASELEAIDYTIAANQHRRENLSESEIVHLVQVRDQRMPRGGDHKSKDAKSKVSPDAIEKSSERTGRLIGVSASTVERIRTVLDSGNEAIIADVTSGKTSVSKAAAKIRVGKKTGKGSKASKKANAKLEACKESATSLKTAEGLLRPYDAALADQAATLRSAVLELIDRAKAEAKEAAKKETAEAKAGKAKKGAKTHVAA